MKNLNLIALEDRCTPATITVTNLLDGTATGDGVSLREAVLSIMKGSKQNDDVVVSTAYGSNDTIVFDAKLAGKTIPVDVADPASDFGPSAFAILKTVTIRGDTTQGITIRRNADVTSTSNLRLFNVLPAGTLTLQNLTLQDGRARGGDGASGASGSGGAAGMGGAIFNRGTVSMSAVTLSGNQAIGGNGTVTVARADNGLGGGGGVGEDGTILNGGDGGAPNGGTRNKAAGFGGGGASGGGNGGFGGGGGAGAGAASGTGGYGGGGGATYSYSGPISPSVFAGGNGVPFGGGGGAAMGGAVFNAGGTTNLTNVTFSGNSTQSGNGGVGAVTAKSGTALGAALYNLNGSVTSINSTFANNTVAFGSGAANTLAPTGSDVYIHQFTGTGIPGTGNTAKVKFLNTISASTAGGVLGLVNNGGTLDSTSTGNLVTQTNLGSGYASTTLAKLALSPLGANGGPVATIAIVTASSARNAGTVSGAPTTDARGESRPTTGNVDAGAYQLKAPQTITFTLQSPATYGVAPITLTTTSDGSTNPITFNHVSGPATLAGNVLTVTGAGDIVVRADQAGNASFASGFATRTLTVNPATLTYTADVKTRPYGVANPALTGTVTGFVNGETVATATTGTLAFGTPATTGSGVGGYPITGNGLSAANYTFAQAAGNATALSVTRVPLTVTANGNEKVYGQPNPLLTFTATGFVNGDTAASAVTGNLGTAATATSGAGLYPITIGTLAAPNYDVTFTPATLAVTKASLAITADNKMRVAGQANPALTAGFAGFVNGDTAAVVTGLVLTTDATATSPAGTYPITATGATAANYAITFVPGTLSVTANTDPGTPPTDPGSTQLVGFRQFAAGADVGGGAVTLYNPDKSVRFTTAPFGADFTGGVRTASADFTGDGIADLVVGTGPGRATRVILTDGATQKQLFTVDPFEAGFTGGVYVAAGDLNGDGFADLVITPDEGGGPRARVFSGKGFGQLADFFGIDDTNFRGGARAAIGDITGDGKSDLVIAAGFGGGPRVAVFSGSKIASEGGLADQSSARWNSWKPFGDFLTFEPELRNGAFVAVGDLNGDGFAELVAGGGPGGGPRVTAFSGKDLLSNVPTPVANFFGGDVTNRGGVRVSVKNLDGDSLADVVVGSGSGAGSRVTAYAGKSISASTPPELYAFDAIDGFSGGVFVG